LQYADAQILDGRVMNPAAAASLLQAVETHVRALVACAPRPAPARVLPSADTAAMTDAELYAHYKRTAPAEDLRFFLRVRMSDALRIWAEGITKPTAQDLARLRVAWRTQRAAEERAAGIPAIGTAEWHRQCADTPADADAPTPDADSGSPVMVGPLAAVVGVAS
jgi:hypothetical protein